MSRKVNLYKKHRYHRHTKKIPQFGGDGDKYKINMTTDPKEMIDFLSKQITDVTVDEVNQKKVTKVAVPKSYKTVFEGILEFQKNELIGYDFKKTGICVRRCDYELTTPMGENFDSTKEYFDPPNVIPPPVEYRTEITIPADKLNTLKYAAKKYKLDVKNAADGKSLPSLNSSDFKILESQLEVTDTGRSRYTLKNVPVNLQQDLEYKLKSVDLKVNIQKLSQSDISVETTSAGFNVLQTFATDNQLIISTQKEGLPFEQIIEKALKNPTEAPQPYDDDKFNELYKTLVEDNEKMKVGGVPLIKKPTELKDKLPLYNLLLKINSIVPPDDNKGTTSLLTRRTYVATFFITIAELQKNPKSDLTPAVLNNTPAAKFFKKLYDVEKPEGLLDAAGRLIPIISTIRDYYTGKHTVSFDSKAIGEEALKKQRKDIDVGIDNEFAIMSAFIGTKSQQVATKTALLAGTATGLWAIVSKIQQNPELSSMIMASVAGIAGPQAAITGAVIIGAALSYFIYLKIQDKYAKYYILIRTMNEYMIVLNKIDRLVRLSVRISGRYNFDVNLKEIEAQLKVLFKRFDKMLSEDDVSQLEKKMYNATTVPDFGAAAAQAEATAEEAANKAMSTEKAGAGDTAANGSDKPQGGGGLGDFIFKFTFDVEMWNQKLNDDVVKLNLYFTTAMTEFSMILNVIQMGLLTSDASGDKTMLKTTNELIKNSTEYRKMVIGILLNDILKLKVDYSYCNRGGGPGGMTKTTDEGVCMDIENMGVDAVGNRRSRFKEKLHGLMEHLVEVLNSNSCPYPEEIKRRIKKAVVLPYIEMINKATPATGPKNPFYLTDSAKIEDQAVADAKQNAISKLNVTAQDPSATTAGGGWFGKSKDIKPSAERDKEIIAELKDRAYDFVSHKELTEFLIAVDKFVKAENEPSVKEKEEAKQVANEMFSDGTLTKSVSYEMAKQQPELDAVNAKNQKYKSWSEAFITGPWAEEEAKKKAQAEAAQASLTEEAAADTSEGGRRLTRKRILNLKKNHHHHRRVSRTRAPFKSAAAALAAFRRG